MLKQEQREIAIGAVRSELRRAGVRPELVDWAGAFRVLDDLLRVEPTLIASRWYALATDNQLRLFKQEWERWRQSAWSADGSLISIPGLGAGVFASGGFQLALSL